MRGQIIKSLIFSLIALIVCLIVCNINKLDFFSILILSIWAFTFPQSVLLFYNIKIYEDRRLNDYGVLLVFMVYILFAPIGFLLYFYNIYRNN